MDGERGDLNPGESNGLSIRALRRSDLVRLVKIDAAIGGRTRRVWFEHKLDRALPEGAQHETDVGISLGVEKDGVLVGALMGAVQFGEYGLPEPVAVLDTLLIDPDYARQGIASALFEQFVVNLRGLRIACLRTEVDWDDLDLIAFFGKAGFKPAARLVLERQLDVE